MKIRETRPVEFTADDHPQLGGNPIDVTHVLMSGLDLIIVVGWDFGEHEPWNEVHQVEMTPEELNQLVIRDKHVHIAWQGVGEADEDDGEVLYDEYEPVVTICAKGSVEPKKYKAEQLPLYPLGSGPMEDGEEDDD